MAAPLHVLIKNIFHVVLKVLSAILRHPYRPVSQQPATASNNARNVIRPGQSMHRSRGRPGQKLSAHSLLSHSLYLSQMRLINRRQTVYETLPASAPFHSRFISLCIKMCNIYIKYSFTHHTPVGLTFFSFLPITVRLSHYPRSVCA